MSSLRNTCRLLGLVDPSLTPTYLCFCPFPTFSWLKPIPIFPLKYKVMRGKLVAAPFWWDLLIPSAPFALCDQFSLQRGLWICSGCSSGLCISNASLWEKALRQTQDSLQRLYLLAVLGRPWNSLRWSEKCVCGVGGQSADCKPLKWSKTHGWIHLHMHAHSLCRTF